MSSAMLEAKGSSWRWEDEGTTSADGLQHYSSVRETLQGGCYRVFRKGDVVVTVQDAESDSIDPENVNLAQIIDLFEVPDGDKTQFEHMVVVFRWLYYNRDTDEGLQSALACIDEPEDGNAKLSRYDFFMSRLIEEERNSVDAIVGKALLCPARQSINDYRERLSEGRKKTREAMKSVDTSTELNFTESDNVYLCRWYYASSEEGKEIPDSGRLIKLTEQALQHFLNHSSPKPDFIYDELHRRFMSDGVARKRLGPGHAKKRQEVSQGGRVTKKPRREENVKSPNAVASKVEGSSGVAVPKKPNSPKSSNFVGGSATEGLSGLEVPKKPKSPKSPKVVGGSGTEVSSERAVPKKPKSPRSPKLTGGSGAEGSSGVGIPKKPKKPDEKLKRRSSASQNVPFLPTSATGKTSKNGNAIETEKPPNSTNQRDDGGSSASVLTKWGITDASSDPERVRRAAKDMTDHLSSLSSEARSEVADLWRLLVGQLESIRLDPRGSYTDEEFATARSKALDEVQILRESTGRKLQEEKNAAALAAFSEGA